MLKRLKYWGSVFISRISFLSSYSPYLYIIPATLGVGVGYGRNYGAEGGASF